MDTPILSTLIFYGTIVLIALCLYKVWHTDSKNKTTRYFIWFIITGCAEILQMIMLGNGMARSYPVLYMFYLPYQFLSPLYFTFFTFCYLQQAFLIKKYKNYLSIPFWSFTGYYTFLKINYILDKRFLSQKIINFISSEIEENITVIFLFLLGLWCYKLVRTYEKHLEHLPYSYVKRQTKWLRGLYLFLILICVFWTLTIFYIYFVGKPNMQYAYYPLWFGFIGFYSSCFWVSFPHLKKIELKRQAGLKIVSHTVNSINVPNINDKIDTIDLTESLENQIVVTPKEGFKNRYQQKIDKELNESKINSVDEQFLQHITGLIEKNLSNPELNVSFLIQELQMSRTQLHRKLTSLTDLSATGFIRWIRIKRAAQLMETGALNVKEIGYKVGFSDQSYFSKCFKKEYHISPTEYVAHKQAESLNVDVFKT